MASVCVRLTKRVRAVKEFERAALIRPSKFISSHFHSASGWQRTSFPQSDPIREPTIEGTSANEMDLDENEVY